jgi:hypothetical protein
MKHIHELTPQEKNRLCAELDGWQIDNTYYKRKKGDSPSQFFVKGQLCSHVDSLPDYSTSFDAIIPLRQKLGMVTLIESSITPLMLLEDTLIATGKALA